MYKLPESLTEDIVEFGDLAKKYKEGEIGNVQFKAHRVPMGIYEQRKDEVYMSRIRTTGGVIYPEQFLKLIEIAQNHNSDLLHITTRQEIQIQNLDLKEVQPILSELQRIGLSTKGGGGNTIRNILVSINSGISDQEVFDTTPYAMQLTSRLIAEADSYLLPRKMKIAFSSDDKDVDYAIINDLGFIAKIQDGQKGFQVYAGGGAGAKPTIGWLLFDFIPVEELYLVSEALKKFFSDHGNRKNKHKARLRFVFYKLGEDETIRLIKEYYNEAKKEGIVFALEEQENERPNFTYQPSNNTTTNAEYDLWKNRYVTPQKQNKYNTILVPFLLGNFYVSNKDLVAGVQKLLKFVAQFGKHTIRFTPAQNIQLRNIPDIAIPELYQILQQVVTDLHKPILINSIVSCTGADTCRLGIGLSKGLATAIRNELYNSNLALDKIADTRIHISGCPNSCGQQLWADIGFSGKILRNDRIYPGYQVYLASRRTSFPRLAEPVGSISAKEIPKFVHLLLSAYLEVKDQYQSLSAYLQTAGREKASSLIEEFKAIPLFTENEDYYYDWGAEKIFSVIGRGIAECSAGLFDMIDVDLNFINNSRETLESEKDPAKRNNLLQDIIYSSSRMLLVTRGVEPKTTNDVFNQFIKNFIEYGFIEDKYKEIVSLARDDKKYDFNPRQEEVFSLSDKVIDLYKSMDDSLQFKNQDNKGVKN